MFKWAKYKKKAREEEEERAASAPCSPVSSPSPSRRPLPNIPGTPEGVRSRSGTQNLPPPPSYVPEPRTPTTAHATPKLKKWHKGKQVEYEGQSITPCLSFKEKLARTDFMDPRTYLAMYDVVPQGPNELAFSRGDQITVICKDNEKWYWVELASSGLQGYAPGAHLGRPRGVQIYRWYHGNLEKQHAERRLGCCVDGAFLIRDASAEVKQQYILSLKADGNVYHHVIYKSGVGYFLTPDRVFRNIPDLVKHYQDKNSDNPSIRLVYQMPKMFLAPCNFPDVKFSDLEVDRSYLRLGKKMWCGKLGDLYRGLLKDVPVVVKTMLNQCDETSEFLHEAHMLRGLTNGKHVVQLLGMCTLEPPYYIALEFMPRGSLLQFLRVHQSLNISLGTDALLTMLLDVTNALDYLERHNVVHRDLCAANCLLDEHLTIKLSGFRLARTINKVLVEPTARLAPRWTSPEGLRDFRFSPKSDIWSMGILIWEVMTHGKVPYSSLTDAEVVEQVCSGYRMPCPPECPEKPYERMLECWATSPDLRPSATKLGSNIKAHISSLSAAKKDLEVARATLTANTVATAQRSTMTLDSRDESAISYADRSVGMTLDSRSVSSFGSAMSERPLPSVPDPSNGMGLTRDRPGSVMDLPHNRADPFVGRPGSVMSRADPFTDRPGSVRSRADPFGDRGGSVMAHRNTVISMGSNADPAPIGSYPADSTHFNSLQDRPLPAAPGSPSAQSYLQHQTSRGSSSQSETKYPLHSERPLPALPDIAERPLPDLPGGNGERPIGQSRGFTSTSLTRVSASHNPLADRPLPSPSPSSPVLSRVNGSGSPTPASPNLSRRPLPAEPR